MQAIDISRPIQAQQELVSRYGFVRRAKDCYLYTVKKTRLIDMYQEDGKAILGWRFGSAQKIFKNVSERGIIGSFASEYQNRLAVVLKQLLPLYTYFTVYTDTAFRSIPELSKSPIWRPWLASMEEETQAPVLQVTIPYPYAAHIHIFASIEQLKTDEQYDVAPPLLAAVTRSFYDLLAQLPQRTEEHFARYDTALLKYWDRKNCYLFPKKTVLTEKNYSEFFCHCLDEGFFISPLYTSPSIIPYNADEGAVCKILN